MERAYAPRVALSTRAHDLNKWVAYPNLRGNTKLHGPSELLAILDLGRTYSERFLFSALACFSILFSFKFFAGDFLVFF